MYQYSFLQAYAQRFILLHTILGKTNLSEQIMLELLYNHSYKKK